MQVTSIPEEELSKHKAEVKARLRKVKSESSRVPLNLYSLIRNLGADPDMLESQEYNTLRALEDGLTAYSAVYERLNDFLDAEARGSREMLDFVNISSLYVCSELINNSLDEVVQELDSNVRTSDKSMQFELFGSEKAETLKYFATKLCETVKATFDDGQPIIRNGSDFANITKELFGTLAEKCVRLTDDYNSLVTKVKGLTFELFDKNVTLFDPINSMQTHEYEMTFDDIVGNTELISTLKTLGDNLLAYNPKTRNNPIFDVFDFPTTALIYGTPGTGKTVTLQAFMNYMQTKSSELGKSFKHINIGNDIKSKYFGESIQNLKAKLMEAMKGDCICAVTMEDIDAIFSARDELNDRPEEKALLQELMNTLEGVMTKRMGNFIVLATSNRPASLDGALGDRLRETQVDVKGPETAADFAQLFKIKMKKGMEHGYVGLRSNDWKKIGETCIEHKDKYNFSGRTIKNITRKLMAKASMFEKPAELYSMSPEDVKEKLGELANKVTYKVIKDEIEYYKEEGIKQEELKEQEKRKKLIEDIITHVTLERYTDALPENIKEMPLDEIRRHLNQSAGVGN